MYRGRGRGRGPTGPKAVARDDDGNAVQVAEGPPPLYPEKELPGLPSEEVLVEAEGLVKSLSTINSGFQNSPFHLGALGDKKSKASMQDSLASVVSLDPNYFPKELYSEEQRSRGGSKEAQAAYWATYQRQRTEAFDFDLGRLEELARQESQRTATADAAGRSGRAAGGSGLLGDEAEGGEEADMEADGGLEDEDAFAPEDDPYEHYDDDEGYEDPDDDAAEGGDAAFF